MTYHRDTRGISSPARYCMHGAMCALRNTLWLIYKEYHISYYPIIQALLETDVIARIACNNSSNLISVECWVGISLKHRRVEKLSNCRTRSRESCERLRSVLVAKWMIRGVGKREAGERAILNFIILVRITPTTDSTIGVWVLPPGWRIKVGGIWKIIITVKKMRIVVTNQWSNSSRGIHQRIHTCQSSLALPNGQTIGGTARTYLFGVSSEIIRE